jgi:hypothetical protein
LDQSIVRDFNLMVSEAPRCRIVKLDNDLFSFCHRKRGLGRSLLCP